MRSPSLARGRAGEGTNSMSNVHRVRIVRKDETNAEADDGTVRIEVRAVAFEPPDELIALTDSGLEEKAWKALVRSGELRARRIGRKLYTTRSALVALVRERDVKAAAQKPKASSAAEAYAALLASDDRPVRR